MDESKMKIIIKNGRKKKREMATLALFPHARFNAAREEFFF